MSKYSSVIFKNSALFFISPMHDTMDETLPDTLVMDETYCVTSPMPNAPARAFMQTNTYAHPVKMTDTAAEPAE